MDKMPKSEVIEFDPDRTLTIDEAVERFRNRLRRVELGRKAWVASRRSAGMRRHRSVPNPADILPETERKQA